MARVTLRVNSEVQLGVSIRYPSENSRGLRPLDPPWLFCAARRTLGGVSTSHPLRYALTPCAATRRWGMLPPYHTYAYACRDSRASPRAAGPAGALAPALLLLEHVLWNFIKAQLVAALAPVFGIRQRSRCEPRADSRPSLSSQENDHNRTVSTAEHVPLPTLIRGRASAGCGTDVAVATIAS